MQTPKKNLNQRNQTPMRFLLNLGTWVFIGVTAGVFSVTGCTSTAEKRADVQETLEGEQPAQSQVDSNSVLLNHKQSALYYDLLKQGNYSDAAIFENFQTLDPLRSDPASLFTNISAPASIGRAPQIATPPRIKRPAPRLSAHWHSTVGWKLILDGNYRGAEAAYRQALRKNPKSAKAYLGLGMALNLQGNRQQAIAAYKKAIGLQPNYAAALVHLGYAYTEGDNKDRNIAKARTLFTQASELGDPFALLALLDLQGRKGSA